MVTGAYKKQLQKEGFDIRRGPEGVMTNVPHLVIEHSPTGFEFGYAGSGPADLALNILEATLRVVGHKGDKATCFRGRCFRLAMGLHQAFKWQFIAPMNRETGAAIPFRTVVDWIDEHMQAEAKVEPKPEAL